MSHLELDYDAAHKFVIEQRKLGADVRWDGWDIILWRYNPRGFTDKHGVFRRNKWGIQRRVSPNWKGMWRVNKRNVRYPR